MPVYAMLYGSIEYSLYIASLLAAKSSGYIGHLAANRVIYRAHYTGIVLYGSILDKV